MRKIRPRGVRRQKAAQTDPSTGKSLCKLIIPQKAVFVHPKLNKIFILFNFMEGQAERCPSPPFVSPISKNWPKLQIGTYWRLFFGFAAAQIDAHARISVLRMRVFRLCVICAGFSISWSWIFLTHSCCNFFSGWNQFLGPFLPRYASTVNRLFLRRKDSHSCLSWLSL